MFTIKDQKKGENSSVEISISISAEEISKHRSHALKHLGEHAEIAGFRKGHVPENILISKFGEQAVLEEAAECAIEETYPQIVADAKINPVAHPKITITKIAPGNPLEFNLTIDVMPQFDLPDYKSIAKKTSKIEAVEVTEKEIDDLIEEIKKYHFKEGDKKEFDDEFVKSLGDFKDVSDFRSKMKDNIKREKETEVLQKNRVNILSAISDKTEMEIPNSFVERELDQMLNEFSHELSRMGQTFENYKNHSKKTEEEIRSDWREKAVSRVKQELILAKIGQEENLKPDPKEVETEVSHMLEHYTEAPKERVVSFVEDMLTKRLVFKFLEEQNK